jgi:uncharacterized protein (TIGR02147 family)
VKSKKSLFEYDDYKAYLIERLNSDFGRGSKSRLADALKCQTSYVAQVIKGRAHFSPEQAEAANMFLSHSEIECDYFHALIQFSRAGTSALKDRISRHLINLRTQNMTLHKRIGVSQSLSEQTQVQFYSAWYFSAIRACVSVNGEKNFHALSQRLQLDVETVKKACEFLLEVGLLKETQGKFEIQEMRSHLGADSPLIAKHHANWRIQALRALDHSKPNDLHYSSVVSLSHTDAATLRARILDFITEAKQLVRESPSEKVQSFCLDFFEV